MNVQESISLVGFKVKDKVTGFEGIVETISFDLYGCVQAVVRPMVGKDNKSNIIGFLYFLYSSSNESSEWSRQSIIPS